MRPYIKQYREDSTLKRTAKFCLAACAALGAALGLLIPRLGENGQYLVGAIIAALSLQGIALLLVVACGRSWPKAAHWYVCARRFVRVRSPWHRPEVTIELPVDG